MRFRGRRCAATPTPRASASASRRPASASARPICSRRCRCATTVPAGRPSRVPGRRSKVASGHGSANAASSSAVGAAKTPAASIVSTRPPSASCVRRTARRLPRASRLFRIRKRPGSLPPCRRYLLRRSPRCRRETLVNTALPCRRNNSSSSRRHCPSSTRRGSTRPLRGPRAAGGLRSRVNATPRPRSCRPSRHERGSRRRSSRSSSVQRRARKTNRSASPRRWTGPRRRP
mmetsp:Transcript_7914/g.24650  ORF Transcript_7914/g.24650 Transcript_7914/m.24650 type:complete len:232 (+) Transcript_7914:295-990(+)